MNERIRELAEQAYKESAALGSQGVIPMSSVREVQLENFAELIVRECADFVDRAISDGGVDGRSLKEHFGVE